MASSSTSSVPKKFRYDAFLSFSGQDTRKTFIDHLYHALQRNSIYTYKDDQEIEKGKGISDELIGAIEDSRYYIIVFSKNYASSSWCLSELVKILMECQKTTEHTVYSIFYDVEPSEVRNQTGAVGEAFARHEEKEGAEEWRRALKEAADVAGWELKNTDDGHEARFIQQLVEKISLKLHSIKVYNDKNIVGMEERIKNIVSSLGTISDDVCMIGIWGMGGSGKTTLAKAVFHQISFQFEGKSFVENVREVSNQPLSGLKLLQSQILSNVSGNVNINVGSVSEGINMMSWKMHGKKVLLVLDDVDHVDQLQALAGDPSWYQQGSIIVITTRDKDVLEAHGVKLILDVNLLSDEEAILLFSRYAFRKEIPLQGYEELSKEVVSYAAGLPLTIKVLGSLLCGKSKLEWVDAIDKLKKFPSKEIQKKLELSFDGLDNEQKEIFLDVATILKGWKKELAIEALESRGFSALIGLSALKQKALITLYDEYVGMHDQLQEMGRNIVRCSHPDMPYKHSRLWDDKELEDILVDDSGTEATKCIQLSTWRLDLETFMNGLRQMKELRLLQVCYIKTKTHPESGKFGRHIRTISRFLGCNVKFDEVRPYFPESLRYLHWDGYPLKYLPKTFQAKNLVGLLMHNSNMVQLWEGGERKVLHKLRFLTFFGFKLRAFDLRPTPNLEKLELFSHGKLVELYMPVECLKLRHLILTRVKLRTFGLTPNLEKMSLYRSELEMFHMSLKCPNLRSLSLNGLKLRTLDLGPSPNFESLYLLQCNDLEEFHISECPLLTDIKISGSKLRTLDLRLVPNLSYFFSGCKGLVELNLPSRCLKLVIFDIYHSKLRTLDLGLMPNLKKLYLKECYDFEELHLGNECQKLVDLRISHSKLRTLDLGLMPNLEYLYLKKCYYLVELHDPITHLKNLVHLDLSGSLVFESFSFLSTFFQPLLELHFTLKICPFHPDNHLLKFESRGFDKEDLPSLTTSIEKLISARPCACTKLERFSRSICRLEDNWKSST